MNEQVEQHCQTCNYFLQHYIWTQKYEPISGGHCLHAPRTRHCRPSAPACPAWTPQTEEYRRLHIPPE